VTFLDFVRLTRANLLVILGSVTLGVMVMFGYTLQQPVVYTATSEGYVVVGAATSAGELLTNMNLQQQKATSYTTLVNDRRVAELVADSLGLDVPPETIAGRLSAYAPEDSSQISISASAGTPQEARDLANAAVVALGDVVHELENAGLPEGAEESDLVQVAPSEEALLPAAPSSPDYQRNLLLGGGGGLVLGYAIALARRSVDRKVRSVAHVEEAGVGAVVGVIPAADPLSRRSRGVGEDLGVVAEAFRQLRTNLRFVDVDHPPRSIVVTSANEGEGKSTVAANLARMIAAAGQPTLLIDADLRKPSLATTFDLDPAVGLTQVLVGDLSVQEVLQETRTPHLQVITAGRIPPNPSELLGSQRMHALIDELGRDYMVILDAPPLLPVTDAGLLSVTCDGALLVVAVGKAAVEQVELCRKVLAQVGGRLLGAVLNLAPSRGLGAVVYGYGGGSFEHGYGEKRGSRRRGRRPSKDQPAPDASAAAEAV
jgi:succinoglycan biosynthesis transport protein ExoP